MTVKLNLGCGSNYLSGWENRDILIDGFDITVLPMPYEDNSIDFINIEHTLEHVTPHQEYLFLEDSFRILKDKGVIRISIPSIVSIVKKADQDYFDFVANNKWGDNTLKSAVRSIIFNHGHLSMPTKEIIGAICQSLGFSTILFPELNKSLASKELENIDGHGSVISNKFTEIETEIIEAIK